MWRFFGLQQIYNVDAFIIIVALILLAVLEYQWARKRLRQKLRLAYRTQLDLHQKLTHLQAIVALRTQVASQSYPIKLGNMSLKAAILELTAKVPSCLIVTPIVIGMERTRNWDQTYVMTLFDIINELVNNTIKHAKASQLLVQLIELDDELTLLIEDNGMGIATSMQGKGFGLELIHNEIAYYGGKLEITSNHGRGTSILITIPIAVPH